MVMSAQVSARSEKTQPFFNVFWKGVLTTFGRSIDVHITFLPYFFLFRSPSMSIGEFMTGRIPVSKIISL